MSISEVLVRPGVYDTAPLPIEDDCDAKSLDEAIAVAARIPPARVGSIEVRPVRTLVAS